MSPAMANRMKIFLPAVDRPVQPVGRNLLLAETAPMRVGRTIAGAVIVAFCIVGCGRHRAAKMGGNVSSAPLSPSAARGRAIFSDNCAVCHGADGQGNQLGPALRAERARRSNAQIAAAILDPSPPMPKLSPAQLSAQDVADVTAYVETL